MQMQMQMHPPPERDNVKLEGGDASS